MIPIRGLRAPVLATPQARPARRSRGLVHDPAHAEKAPAWTPAEDATLATLWKDGRTGGQIAAELQGRSREAVIGRANRLGLPRRRSPIRREVGHG